GFRPIMADSNGKGGYWVDVIFDQPILTDTARRLGLWLTRDWRELGLADPPEVFPKQFEITPKGRGACGNWTRLYGRHPKRNSWTLVYADCEGLEGDDAIDAILGTDGDSPRLIPQEVLGFQCDARRRELDPDAEPAEPRSEEDLARDARLA